MKLDIPDDYVPLIVRALETQSAYMKATNRDDSRYQEIAEMFKGRKSVVSETAEPGKKKRTGRCA
jgi:hypothetical protein